MYLLDTNICIYAIKKSFPSVLSSIQIHFDDGLHLSSITIAELEFGIENSNSKHKNRMALVEFLSAFEIIDFNDNDAIAYGRIKAALRRAGNPIGEIDTLLAAQAVARNLVMVTHNTKEFSRVEDLRLEDWAL